MAFLYKQFRKVAGRKVLASPFWYVEHRDPAKVTHSPAGKIRPVREVTAFRIANVRETAQARELEARLTLRERTVRSATGESAFKRWVLPFIAKIENPKSRERYLTAWRMLEMWLAEADIQYPAQVSYAICETYIPWREKPDPAERKFAVRRSTANFEFKFFRRLMKKAVHFGYTQNNPAREVELPRLKSQPRILKPDLTDDQLQAIWRAFAAEPGPRQTCFRRAFAIALLHGARVNETNLNPQTDLRLDDDIPAIKFLQKGGRVRWKPLHPQLLGFFKTLRAAGHQQTYPLERDAEGRFKWNTAWHNFFTHKPDHEIHFKKRDGLEHICFHSLRVTVENVLREANVPKEIREMYLTHEHERADDVNAEYDRVKLREMLVCHAHLRRDWLKLE
jgi:integrase